MLAHGQQEGWSHVCLDGTLISTDRVGTRSEAGHHLWYSGKHQTQGANVQIIADPTGFPVWPAPVEPGSVHALTAARHQLLSALYAAAPAGLPTLADNGYDGTHAGIHTPVRPGVFTAALIRRGFGVSRHGKVPLTWDDVD